MPPLGGFFPAVRYSISLDSSERGSDEISNYAIGATGSRPSSSEIANAAANAALERLQLITNVKKVRVIVSSGGRFKPPGGRMSGSSSSGNTKGYEGGEVRLISVPEGCSFAELVLSLSKTSTSSSTESTVRKSAGRGDKLGGHYGAPTTTSLASNGRLTDLLPRVCIIRYELPSDPSVLVDVVDDEDTKLMFEEYAELKQRMGPTAPKLHMFVEWLGSTIGGGSGRYGSFGSHEMLGAFSGFLPGSHSSESEEGA